MSGPMTAICTPLQPATARPAGTSTSISGRVSTPAIVGETVFIASLQAGDQPSGELYALDRNTGTPRWRYRTTSGNQIAPPVAKDGVVYSPSSDTGLYAFDAADGKIRWQAATGPMGGQPPAIAGDAIYLATDRSAAAFSLTDGSKLWEMDMKADLDDGAIVSGGMMFVSDNAGVVHALAEPGLAAAPSAPPASSVPKLVVDPSPQLKLLATFTAATSGLTTPRGSLSASRATSLVVITLGSEIRVLDPHDGSVIRRFGSKGSDPGQFNFLRDPSDPSSAIGGIAVAPDGTAYVADSANARVQVFDAMGTFQRQWGRFGSSDGQFLEPIDVAIAPDGSVLVVDDQRDDIQRFTETGTFIDSIGGHGTGPGQMNFTGGISVGSDGTIYNADWDNRRVQAFDARGSFLWSVPATVPGPDGNPVMSSWTDGGASMSACGSTSRASTRLGPSLVTRPSL